MIETRIRPGIVEFLACVFSVALICLALWQLEGQRRGGEISTFTVSDTAITRMAMTGAEGPVVVVAHGFAGSLQMM